MSSRAMSAVSALSGRSFVFDDLDLECNSPIPRVPPKSGRMVTIVSPDSENQVGENAETPTSAAYCGRRSDAVAPVAASVAPTPAGILKSAHRTSSRSSAPLIIGAPLPPSLKPVNTAGPVATSSRPQTAQMARREPATPSQRRQRSEASEAGGGAVTPYVAAYKASLAAAQEAARAAAAIAIGGEAAQAVTEPEEVGPGRSARKAARGGSPTAMRLVRSALTFDMETPAVWKKNAHGASPVEPTAEELEAEAIMRQPLQLAAAASEVSARSGKTTTTSNAAAHRASEQQQRAEEKRHKVQKDAKKESKARAAKKQQRSKRREPSTSTAEDSDSASSYDDRSDDAPESEEESPAKPVAKPATNNKSKGRVEAAQAASKAPKSKSAGKDKSKAPQRRAPEETVTAGIADRVRRHNAAKPTAPAAVLYDSEDDSDEPAQQPHRVRRLTAELQRSVPRDVETALFGQRPQQQQPSNRAASRRGKSKSLEPTIVRRNQGRGSNADLSPQEATSPEEVFDTSSSSDTASPLAGRQRGGKAVAARGPPEKKKSAAAAKKVSAAQRAAEQQAELKRVAEAAIRARQQTRVAAVAPSQPNTTAMKGASGNRRGALPRTQSVSFADMPENSATGRQAPRLPPARRQPQRQAPVIDRDDDDDDKAFLDYDVVPDPMAEELAHDDSFDEADNDTDIGQRYGVMSSAFQRAPPQSFLPQAPPQRAAQQPQVTQQPPMSAMRTRSTNVPPMGPKPRAAPTPAAIPPHRGATSGPLMLAPRPLSVGRGVSMRGQSAGIGSAAAPADNDPMLAFFQKAFPTVAIAPINLSSVARRGAGAGMQLPFAIGGSRRRAI